MVSDEKGGAENNPCGRPGKAHEDETGNHRKPHRPDENLDRDDDMAKEGSRKHVTVAHRGECLDAEEKGRPKGAGRHFADGAGTEGIEQREERIEHEIAADEKKRELRPAKREDPVIAIAPI